jgi:hypothetical protein
MDSKNNTFQKGRAILMVKANFDDDYDDIIAAQTTKSGNVTSAITSAITSVLLVGRKLFLW